MSKKVDKLKKLAVPLIGYIKENYDPYCEVVVDYKGVKVIRTEKYIPVDEMHQPPERFVPEDSHGKCLNSESIRCPN